MFTCLCELLSYNLIGLTLTKVCILYVFIFKCYTSDTFQQVSSGFLVLLVFDICAMLLCFLFVFSVAFL